MQVETQPWVKHPLETRTFRLDFANQPELDTLGDSLNGTPNVGVILSPEYQSGALPTLGTPTIAQLVAGVTVSAGGTGYTSPPAVAFIGGSPLDRPAQGVAVIDNTGRVVGVNVTRAGLYNGVPSISFFGTGAGAAATPVMANSTKVAFQVSSGDDMTDYVVTISCPTLAGSTLAESVLLQVRSRTGRQ
jgi:hypothetical protein